MCDDTRDVHSCGRTDDAPKPSKIPTQNEIDNAAAVSTRRIKKNILHFMTNFILFRDDIYQCSGKNLFSMYIQNNLK